MKVKTDTKEKFHAINVETEHLSANMAAELSKQLFEFLQSANRNIVLKLPLVTTLDKEAAETLVKVQQKFYEGNASFVICELTSEAEAFLDKEGLLELMNVTPTESEAWDIVQMEEIERELLGDE
jgi:anti-anti-sigma regulatory factor